MIYYSYILERGNGVISALRPNYLACFSYYVLLWMSWFIPVYVRILGHRIHGSYLMEHGKQNVLSSQVPLHPLGLCQPEANDFSIKNSNISQFKSGKYFSALYLKHYLVGLCS